MRPASSRPGRGPRGVAALRAVAAVALVAVVGCGEGAGTTGEAADTAAAEAAETAGDRRIRGDTVVIGMDEYIIDVPSTLPAGRHVFRVENLGFEEHNLEVHRDSLLYDLRPLNPRATGHLEVELEPGTYRLICTVSGHEGRGMSEEITVTESGGSAPP